MSIDEEVRICDEAVPWYILSDKDDVLLFDILTEKSSTKAEALKLFRVIVISTFIQENINS